MARTACDEGQRHIFRRHLRGRCFADAIATLRVIQRDLRVALKHRFAGRVIAAPSPALVMEVAVNSTASGLLSGSSGRCRSSRRAPYARPRPSDCNPDSETPGLSRKNAYGYRVDDVLEHVLRAPCFHRHVEQGRTDGPPFVLLLIDKRTSLRPPARMSSIKGMTRRSG